VPVYGSLEFFLESFHIKRFHSVATATIAGMEWDFRCTVIRRFGRFLKTRRKEKSVAAITGRLTANHP